MTKKLLVGLAIAVTLAVALFPLRGVLLGKPFWKASQTVPSTVDGYVVRIAGDGSVLGPGTSVLPGETIGFAASAPAETSWTPKILNVAGHVVATLPTVHVSPPNWKSASPWLDGTGDPVVETWTVPADLPSGFYYVAGDRELFFAVRENKPRPSPIVVLLPTNTITAYSSTDGRSLYAHPTKVAGVSFLRPMDQGRSEGWLPFLQWLSDQKPFAAPVAFAVDVDMEDPALLDNAKILIVLGHSEYWTRAARKNFDAFVDRGGNAIMAGGNDMWWQARYSPDRRTMFVYRLLAGKPLSNGGDGETNPIFLTKEWDTPALGYPIISSIGGDFRHGGFGQLANQNGLFRSAYTVAEADSPVFAGTGLKTCDRIELPRSTEYDGSPIVGLDAIGRPIADLKAIGAYRYELLAYEWNHNTKYQLGTMQILQRKPDSGYVLHMGARGCCITEAFYKKGAEGKTIVQQILRNAVALFLTRTDPLANAPSPRPVVFPMSTPWGGAMPPVPENACEPHMGDAELENPEAGSD